MNILATVLLGLPVAVFVASYAAYPAILMLAVAFTRRAGQRTSDEDKDWPKLSILIPVYNEESVIRRKLENLLAVDYPTELCQIVVVSDASTDGTDEIVQEFADRSVELVRLSDRRGKTEAQNAAVSYLRGEIVVSTDATTRLGPNSLKALIRPFRDPDVGVASGRNVSIGVEDGPVAAGEAGYVNYEMWVRSLETSLGGIVGASGCFYAMRNRLFNSMYPAELSRDFGTVLLARREGLRAVSVDDALCYVPRSGSIRGEMRRKARTMARGLETLWHFRRLLNPLRYGAFALMLGIHKLGRWLTYLMYPLGLAVLGWFALVGSSLARAVFLLILSVGGVGLLAVFWPEEEPGRQRPMPAWMAVLGYPVAAGIAGVQAWIKFLLGERNPIWEPTRRQDTASTSRIAE